ncbi:hypothetical protein KY284_010605 [Solanum tuberosum]|nr:hypothetical protein KY284_010605 [Solanum tuberosum]
MIFDKIVDSTVEWIGVSEKIRDNQFKEKTIEFGVASDMAKIPNNSQEEVCNASDDELMTLQGDSDDDNSKRFIVFNAKRDLEDPKFEFTLNMIFNSSKEFKWAVEVSNCKWLIYASNTNEDEPFMIKTISPDHSCGNKRENRTIDSGFLAKKYAHEFKINPSWGVKEFQTHVMRKHSCTLNRHQSYRVKKKALDLITGTKEEQFDMLWDYCAELRRSNPGTTSCKQGFLARCQPIIVVDGCHLKGYQKGGQLLTTIGIDANNNMYPIAFAIVEGFGGQALKEVLWKASRATTEPEFSKHMEEMSKIDIDAPKRGS